MAKLFLIFVLTVADIVFCLTLPLSAKADEQASARLARLKTDLSGIIAIEGTFVQEKRLNYLKESVRSSGEFSFTRPDYLKWEYIKPAYSGVEINGTKIKMWSGPPQARYDQPETMNKIGSIVANQVMIWMNMDPDQILSANEVTLISENPLRLKVTPKKLKVRGMLESMEVIFTKSGHTVSQVILKEPEGHTIISFADVHLNSGAGGTGRRP